MFRLRVNFFVRRACAFVRERLITIRALIAVGKNYELYNLISISLELLTACRLGEFVRAAQDSNVERTSFRRTSTFVEHPNGSANALCKNRGG